MASLNGLPNELLVEVFSRLGGIDDVINLSQSFPGAQQVINTRGFYLSIMRAVILSSHTHRFDVQLCRLLALQKDLPNSLSATQPCIYITRDAPLAVATFRDANELRLRDSILEAVHGISDDQIDDIVARYKGLRTLQSLYLLTPPTAPFLDPNLQDNELLRSSDAVQARNPEPADADLLSNASQRLGYTRVLDSAQRGRFHAAVTHYWILHIVRWTQCHFGYLYPSMGSNLRYDILTFLGLQCTSPLLDTFDLLEVYSFLYKHLLPRHARTLADQDTSMTYLSHTSGSYPDDGQRLFPTALPSLNIPPNTHSHLTVNPTLSRAGYGTGAVRPLDTVGSFKTFYLGACAALSPADIIDLTIRDYLMRHPPYPLLTPPSSSLAAWVPSSDCIMDRQHRWVRLGSFTNDHSIYRGVTHDDPHFIFLQERIVLLAAESLKGYKGKLDRVKMWNNWRKDVKGCVWWWAASEEKAKMKVQRWKEKGLWPLEH
ncbi:uncharacterized protein BDZ99DRAFT_556591 [Mytilinidion resinicola]|uniref:F-box domain-containing protein n=1 Tax=Mytilinidion resinicola TaxID=574789 RepID=A0A6A6YXS5_9PEZI|nr:uncharacterized protein BDZ99DRAFT_556591 [Mytilinidion resinicola]KAF2813223.1 hypothetical protein BDZ99DRAFT_556591 [Mytilinidion resinicola]